MTQLKKVFITGASRGIGLGIAKMFAANGYQVIGTATSDEGANKITQALQQIGENNHGVQLVFSINTDIESQIKAIADQYGPFDIVINNAGMTADNLFMRMKKQQWDDVIHANLTAMYAVTKALLRPMVKQRWGRIINISSVVAMTGNLGQANYAAAKAGVIAMSKSLAQEVARYHVTVNCIAPGFIQTDMTTQLPDSVQQEILKQIPMGAMGEVNDIAHAVAFLCGENAKYITGTVLHVNGGMFMA